MIVYSPPECNVSTPLNISIWSTYAVVVAVNANYTTRQTNKKSFPVLVQYIYSISLEFQDCTRSLCGCFTMFCQVIGKLYKLFLSESFEVVLLSFLRNVAFPFKIKIFIFYFYLLTLRHTLWYEAANNKQIDIKSEYTSNPFISTFSLRDRTRHELLEAVASITNFFFYPVDNVDVNILPTILDPFACTSRQVE